jgi:chromosome segregation ATPase
MRKGVRRLLKRTKTAHEPKVSQMPESFWEQGVAVEADPGAAPKEPHAEAGSLAVSADDFSALEERVMRAVEMVKRERGERAAAEALARMAEQRAAAAEARIAESEERVRAAEGRAGRNDEFIKQAEARIKSAEDRVTEVAERARLAEAQLHEQIPVLEQLQAELKAHKSERDQVRQRVERLLKQLDGLEL